MLKLQSHQFWLIWNTVLAVIFIFYGYFAFKQLLLLLYEIDTFDSIVKTAFLYYDGEVAIRRPACLTQFLGHCGNLKSEGQHDEISFSILAIYGPKASSILYHPGDLQSEGTS